MSGAIFLKCFLSFLRNRLNLPTLCNYEAGRTRLLVGKGTRGKIRPICTYARAPRPTPGDLEPQHALSQQPLKHKVESLHL